MQKSERLGLRVTPEDKKEWQQAALAQGLSLSEWITKWASMGLAYNELTIPARRGTL